jgi:hypothetical protein
MKAIILIICCCVVVLSFSHNGKKAAGRITKSIASAHTDTLDFKKDIQPILQKNCSPCHFPGGKMYERMPFDKGETIISHEAGALKRFRDLHEKALVIQFIKQSKSGTH